MDEIGEPLGASRQNDLETGRPSGLEVRTEWAKENGEYGELLRIAKQLTRPDGKSTSSLCKI